MLYVVLISRPSETIKRKLYAETDEELQYLTPEEIEKLKEEEKRDPIVTENTSEFILTLEYIEVILPEDLSQGEDIL